MPDVFPGDLLQEIRDLKQRVADLEAQAKARPGMTTASQGWILPAMATPDTSGIAAAGGQIYFKGGRLTARNGGNGSEIQLEPVPTAFDSGEITTTDAGASYTPLVQQLINECKSKHNAMRTNLRAAGLMA